MALVLVVERALAMSATPASCVMNVLTASMNSRTTMDEWFANVSEAAVKLNLTVS